MSAVPAPTADRQWDVALAIGVGGAAGAAARYGVGVALPHREGTFPWATFWVNVSGCLLVGVLMVLVLEVWGPSRYARPFLGIGLLGGYTTFSTYAVETRGLLAGGHAGTGLAYLAGSLAAGLAATWLGMLLARRVAR